MIISVSRSPLRLLTMALVAVPMILLALDMSVTYRFFPKPATTATDPETGASIELTEDVLTRDGEAQRRREVAFSLVLAVGGIAMLGWAAKDLLAPKRLIEADEDGILLDVTRRGEPPVRLLWEDVIDIRSGAITDDAGTTPALVIRVEDPELLPERPYGAVVDANEIRLYSDEWERSAQDVAATLSLRVTRERGTGEVPQT